MELKNGRKLKKGDKYGYFFKSFFYFFGYDNFDCFMRIFYYSFNRTSKFDSLNH